jgi:hypothetical protein
MSSIYAKHEAFNKIITKYKTYKTGLQIMLKIPHEMQKESETTKRTQTQYPLIAAALRTNTNT